MDQINGSQIIKNRKSLVKIQLIILIKLRKIQKIKKDNLKD